MSSEDKVKQSTEEKPKTFEETLVEKILAEAKLAIAPLQTAFDKEKTDYEKDRKNIQKELEDVRRSLQAIQSSLAEYECALCGKHVLSAVGGFYRESDGRILCGARCLDKFMLIKEELALGKTVKPEKTTVPDKS